MKEFLIVKTYSSVHEHTIEVTNKLNDGWEIVVSGQYPIGMQNFYYTHMVKETEDEKENNS